MLAKMASFLTIMLHFRLHPVTFAQLTKCGYACFLGRLLSTGFSQTFV